MQIWISQITIEAEYYIKAKKIKPNNFTAKFWKFPGEISEFGYYFFS